MLKYLHFIQLTMKWKYQKQQKKSSYDTYLRLEDNKPTEIKINYWTFERNPYSEALFTSEVVEVDGAKVDKVWSVWDPELRDELKKLLKDKNPIKDTFRLTIVKRTVDEEEHFEILKK